MLIYLHIKGEKGEEEIINMDLIQLIFKESEKDLVFIGARPQSRTIIHFEEEGSCDNVMQKIISAYELNMRTLEI